MPTTLTLDDDLAGLLRNAAQQQGQPLSEMGLSLLRSALAKRATGVAPAAPFRIRPHNGVFAPGVDLKKLNHLADYLDADAIL